MTKITDFKPQRRNANKHTEEVSASCDLGAVVTEAIRFPAEIVKVQTMQDGAIRLTLDLPAGEIGAATELMEAKQRGALLAVAAVAVMPNERKEKDYGL